MFTNNWRCFTNSLLYVESHNCNNKYPEDTRRYRPAGQLAYRNSQGKPSAATTEPRGPYLLAYGLERALLLVFGATGGKQCPIILSVLQGGNHVE